MSFRPKGSANLPGYSPQRDIAYLYPHAMREAIAGLDEVNWRDYFKPWIEAAAVSEEDLGEGVKRFVEAHKDFIGDPEIKHADDAMAKHGFFELPNIVRILLYARLGEVMVGGFFYALRDVTQQGHAPPHVADIADFIAEGRLVAERIWGKKTPPTELQALEHEVLSAHEQLEGLYRTVNALQCEKAKLQEAVLLLKQELTSKDICVTHAAYREGRSLWRRILEWPRMPWRNK